MSGEQEEIDDITGDATGSSPRARGTVPDRFGGLYGHGIIPACAGNSRSDSPTGSASWDHPRVRGEQVDTNILAQQTPGSSPRARGTGVAVFQALRLSGIIPACAGNRSRHACTKAIRRDHPRVRGEQQPASNSVAPVRGSSPRARGTDVAPDHGHLRCGIIPACAGNRCPRFGRASRGGDHPRVRGEQFKVKQYATGQAGSSPRARGTGGALLGDLATAGIIPACAGNRGRKSRRPTSVRDHPRVRGEQTAATVGAPSLLGSSPRARGTVIEDAGDGSQRGIIPACAGNR